MMYLKITFLLFILKAANGDETIQTKSGPLRGSTVASGKVEAFLGVPYAEPPVGPLRFTKPVPKVPWENVYDAKELPPACIQLNSDDFTELSNMSEDCLYLNLWVPQTKDKRKTVMLFIHGGGFFAGSSNEKLYNGARLAEHGDVIVATINYRLGALGYFSGLIDEAPGSMGMYDQVMAIQWIKDNAEHFHGDPDNIVLFGESAGAFSISLHQISPLSKNLFNRAILQSGSSLHPMYSIDNKQLLELSQAYAEIAGCTSDGVTINSNPKSVVDCLKSIPAEKMSEVEMEFLVKYSLRKFIIPRTGDDFLPETTIDAFRKGHFKEDAEVLMGITRDEGTLLLALHRNGWFEAHKDKDVNEICNETLARDVIKFYIESGNENEDNKVVQSYLDRVNDETGYTYLKATSDAFGDFLINCGAIFQAEFQSLRDVPVYFYMFDYRPASTANPEWMGVTHFEEVQYVFGNPMYKDFTEQERELSRDMMDMWVSFAKTGNPNIPGGVQWPRFTHNDPKFYIIGKRDSLGLGPDNNRCESWRNAFRSVIDDNFIQTINTH